MTFQPGNKLAVGNTNGGRTRSELLTKALISQINELVKKGDPSGRTKLAKMVDELIEKGMNGEMAAIEFIWNRIEGPMKNVTELKNADGEVLHIELIRRVIVDPAMKTIEGDKVAEDAPAA